MFAPIATLAAASQWRWMGEEYGSTYVEVFPDLASEAAAGVNAQCLREILEITDSRILAETGFESRRTSTTMSFAE